MWYIVMKSSTPLNLSPSLFVWIFCSLLLGLGLCACEANSGSQPSAASIESVQVKKDMPQERSKEDADSHIQLTGAPKPPEKTPEQIKEQVEHAQTVNAEILKSDTRRFIEDEQNTINIFDTAAPATVFVTQSQIITNWRTTATTEVPAGTGTGFIWDQRGHIVTNYHIISGGSSWSVTLYNQKTYDATLVGGDPKKDIAVLKINAPASELSPITLPPEDFSIAVGQKAIAIGNPFGLDHTLTTGIISAIGRDLRGFGGVTIKEMVQTDASINPGNSGGPLLDSRGQLIGMNTMILSQSGSSAGIGFAVPVSTIRRIVPQIIETGRAEQVGLGILTVPDAAARRYGVRGVIVQAVMENAPAQKAGLKGIVSTPQGYYIGDIIVGIDDEPVRNLNDLYSAVDGHHPGDVVSVKVLRDGKALSLDIELFVIND